MCKQSICRRLIAAKELQEAMNQLASLRQLTKKQLTFLADQGHSDLSRDYQKLVYNTNFTWQLVLEAQDFYKGLSQNPGPYSLNQLYEDLIRCANQWSLFQKKLNAKMSRS